MKLPKEFDKYSFNKYCDEVLEDAKALAATTSDDYNLDPVYRGNLLLIKIMQSKLLHLELVLDEMIGR